MNPEIVALEMLKVFLLFCILVLTWLNHRILLSHHNEVVKDYRHAMDKLRGKEAELARHNRETYGPGIKGAPESSE